MVAESTVSGPDAQRHIDGIRLYIDAGYYDVHIHPFDPDPQEFVRVCEREVLPHVW